uniref:Uncharacterized protein n=1 Tax=Encephalitozoon cuniculi TaxID=6035 RepID=M1K844_ENCCN|nr:hypothetical protein ECU04_1410 [Encephalitozoon cuniculi]
MPTNISSTGENKQTFLSAMIILMIMECLHAMQNELTSRCQKYGISLNDCLNSVYMPKREYDEYLQSFNLPIIRDSSCTKGRCMAVVYKDMNRCMNCRKEQCRDECGELEWMREDLASRAAGAYQRDAESQIPLIHVIHHKEADRRTAGMPRITEAPSVSYKSITVIETKTETVSEQPVTSSRSEERQDTRTSEASTIHETQREETKTVFRTVEIPQVLERTSREARPGRSEIQMKRGDNDSKALPEDSENSRAIPVSIKRSKFKYSLPELEKMDDGSEDERGVEDEKKEKSEPTVVTVTRVFYKTISVEKPITLYREVTTTVKNEVPIINYKLTTVREISTATKTESSTKTETVVQTQYSMIISTKTQYNQEASSSREVSISTGPRTVSSETSKKDDGGHKDIKISEAPGKEERATTSPSVVYRTVTKPATSILTVTKIQEKTMQLELGSGEIHDSASQKKESTSANTIGSSPVASLICTEKCSTAGVLSSSGKNDVASSTVGVPAPATQSLVSAGRQDIIAELLPLVRKVLIEDAEETKPPKSSKKSSSAEMSNDVTRTVTKTVVRTIEREVRNKGGHKTIYSTVYSYKKKPSCRKGVEGKKKRVCKDAEEELVTTVYV